jgi:hypothetical protein
MALGVGSKVKRFFLLVVLFLIIFFTIFVVGSIIFFINTVRYDEGVVFSYPAPVFIYVLKASLGGASASSVILWWYVISEYRG